jgi:hypothetical protein
MEDDGPESAISSTAPKSADLTPYDRAHLATYLRLLDAEAEGADWREVARLVLGLDPDHDEPASQRTYESHLKRARWIATSGYRHLLTGGSAV